MDFVLVLAWQQRPECLTPKGTLRLVHQLDYATSGLICIAKTKWGAAAASKAFEKRLAKKTYLALVDGRLEPDAPHFDAMACVSKRSTTSLEDCLLGGVELEVSAWLAPAPDGFSVCTAEPGDVGAQSAQTFVAVLRHSRLRGRDVSLLRLRPVTGRRHQLRVHLQLLGFPIAGDFTYGTLPDPALEPLRMMLHAWRLQLQLAAEKELAVSPAQAVFPLARAAPLYPTFHGPAALSCPPHSNVKLWGYR